MGNHGPSLLGRNLDHAVQVWRGHRVADGSYEQTIEPSDRYTRRIELSRKKDEPFGLQLRWHKYGLEVLSIVPTSAASRHNALNPEDAFSKGDMIIEVNGFRSHHDMDAALNGCTATLVVYSTADMSPAPETIGLL